MHWSETKDGKICRRNPPSNSLGNKQTARSNIWQPITIYGPPVDRDIDFWHQKGIRKSFPATKKFPIYRRGEKHSTMYMCTIKIGKFWGENWLPKGWTEKVLKLLSMKLMPFNPTSIVGGCINELKIFYSHDILEYQFYWIYYTW